MRTGNSPHSFGLGSVGGNAVCLRAGRSRYRGFTLFYFLFAWTVIIGTCSFAVDFGRVSYVKAQLQTAADAAARVAVCNLSTSIAAAQNSAVAIAAANTADGATVVIDPNNDIQFGTWNSAAQSFTVLTGSQQSSSTAVKVTAHRTIADGNPVSLLFASLIGQGSCSVRTTAIACLSTGASLANASFESPALSYGGYIYGQAMTGWTLNSAACLATYGSAWSMPQPVGNQAIALQGGYGNVANIVQTFSTSGGVYSVSFNAAQRTSYYIGNPRQPITISIDGTVIETFTPIDGSFRLHNTPTFVLATGTHTVSMAATDGTTDKTTFVDNIAINRSGSCVALAK